MIKKYKIKENEFDEFNAILNSNVQKPKKKKRSLIEDFNSNKEIKRLSKKIGKKSDKVNLPLTVHYFDKADEEKIKEMYRITELFKESTFAHIYKVG